MLFNTKNTQFVFYLVWFSIFDLILFFVWILLFKPMDCQNIVFLFFKEYTLFIRNKAELLIYPLKIYFIAIIWF